MSRSPDWANSLGKRREGQRLSHSLPGALQAGRPGVTLLELIVVLALLGLILAIAAPMFITPPENPSESGLQTARRQAVLRSKPVTVSVNGTRVHITPLGVCLADAPLRAAQATWDAIGCSGFQRVRVIETGFNDSDPLKSSRGNAR